MRQSVKIILQCINQLPEGLVKIDDRKLTPPSREEIKSSMEALIHHFKLYSKGFKKLMKPMFQLRLQRGNSEYT